jgi:hypothetical protein
MRHKRKRKIFASSMPPVFLLMGEDLVYRIAGRGHFCLVPRKAAPADLIYIPFGSKVPFVFRKNNGYFKNIGECYVHGMMHEEAFAEKEVEELEIILH